ncbi:MAG TPA: hypothetical protein VF595_00255, partial [Tepidisphaeraceae bacterium]
MTPHLLGMLVAIVLLIRVGQTFLLAGVVRSKNAADVGMRCVLDLAVAVLAVWAFAGPFFPRPVVGGATLPLIAWRQLFGNDAEKVLFAILPLVLIATGALHGATAERTRLGPVLVLTGVLAAVAMPIVPWFFVSVFSNPSRVQTGLIAATIGGGAAAYVMAAVSGARKGKFNRDLSVNFVPGHSVPMQVGGLLLLATGWAAATPNALHTLLGFAASLLTAALFARWKFGKIDVGLLMTSGVGGLAAGGLAAVEFQTGYSPLAHFGGDSGILSVLAGAIAGLAVPLAVIWVETRLRTDDVAGFSAAYVVGGTVGMSVAMLSRSADVGTYFRGIGVAAGAWVLSVLLCSGAAYL